MADSWDPQCPRPNTSKPLTYPGRPLTAPAHSRQQQPPATAPAHGHHRRRPCRTSRAREAPPPLVQPLDAMAFPSCISRGLHLPLYLHIPNPNPTPPPKTLNLKTLTPPPRAKHPKHLSAMVSNCSSAGGSSPVSLCVCGIRGTNQWRHCIGMVRRPAMAGKARRARSESASGRPAGAAAQLTQNACSHNTQPASCNA